MKNRRRHTALLVVVCLCGLALGICGCEGTDTREQVDDTVETVTGKKALDTYQQAKETLGEIDEQAAKRYEQLDPDGGEEK